MKKSIHRIKAICKREFASYFNSPLAYLFLIVFLVISSFFTFQFAGWFEANEANLKIFFGSHPYLYLIFLPAIGMRLWSEEENDGTIELLLTMPITFLEAIIGKFLAAWLFLLVALILTFPAVITVWYLGNPDLGMIFCGYLGSFLVGGTFLSICSLISSLTKNLVVSYIVSFIILLFFLLAGVPELTLFIANFIPTSFTDFIASFAIQPHYESLQRGVLDSRDFIYNFSFIAFCLGCNVIFLKYRKSSHKRNKQFAALGVFLLSVILVCLNLLFHNINIRLDLTQDKLYTLSENSKNVITKLKKPITIHFYYSRHMFFELPQEFKSLASETQDLLREYEQASKGNISFKIIDPIPDSEIETIALKAGIKPQPIGDNNRFYLGLTMNFEGNSLKIPILETSNKQTLEYDLTRMINRFTLVKKKKIGVVYNLPVFGNPAMPAMGRIKPTPPWKIISELMKDFDLVKLDLQSPKAIPEDIETVLIIHPPYLKISFLYKLDQFLMRKGKLIAFLDPLSAISMNKTMAYKTTVALPNASNLSGLYESWGVAMYNKIVRDPKYPSIIKNSQNTMLMTLTSEALNKNFPGAETINKLYYPYGSAFRIRKLDGVKYTPLLKSSPKAILMPREQFNSLDIPKNAKKQEFTLALRIQGKIKSAFNDFTNNTFKGKSHLKSSKNAVDIVLVADADMLHDRFSFNENKMTRLSQNFEFFMNIADEVINNGALVELRSRKRPQRKLTKLMELKIKSSLQWNSERQKLLISLQKSTQEKNKFLYKEQLQKTLTDDEYSILSQKTTEIKSLNEQLQELDRKMKLELNHLQRQLAWANILIIPFLTALIGLLRLKFPKKKYIL